MTAPSAVTEIASEIASIQARISAITARGGATSSASSFATALSSATPAPVATSAAATVSDGSASAIVKKAESYLGTPYVWGGESRSGIDCSGLVQAACKAAGIDVPRVAADQQRLGSSVPSLAQAQPGDLLFFGEPAYHVAIYLGNNRLIESPEPGKTVHITDVYQTPTSIRRVAAAAPGSEPNVSSGVHAYDAQFRAAEGRFDLPSGLLAAVAQQESGGNAHAVSPAGARGLMQLMPSTAAGMGVDPDDPAQAITAAARILSGSLHRYHGSIELALAAYNAGAGAVARYGGIPPYTETQNYVRSITAMLAAGG